MSDTGLVVGLAILGTLVAVAVVLAAATFAALFVRERMGKQAAERRAAEAEAHAAELNSELRNFRRARNNKLYRHALEDVGFAVQQGLLRIKAERARSQEEWAVIEQLLETGKKGLEP